MSRREFLLGAGASGGLLLAGLGFGTCATRTTRTSRASASSPPRASTQPSISSPGTPTGWPSFPTREQALARQKVVVASGILGAQYRIGSPPTNTTYDLRGLVSTAYPDSTTFPLSFGDDKPAVGTVVIGGTVLGNLPTDITWQQIYETYDSVGAGLLLTGLEHFAVYDFRADNVMDGLRPRSNTPEGAVFLFEGAYCSNLRDDCVENDESLSGFIRDCLFEGIHMGISLGQETPNRSAVTTIENSIFAFKPFPNDNGPGRVGHGRIFKYFPGGGSVVMRNCIIYYESTPIDVQFTTFWPPGTYENVTIVLGPRYDGDGDGDVTDLDHPGRLPPGVEQTRDVTVYQDARRAWLVDHGYRGEN